MSVIRHDDPEVQIVAAAVIVQDMDDNLLHRLRRQCAARGAKGDEVDAAAELPVRQVPPALSQFGFHGRSLPTSSRSGTPARHRRRTFGLSGSDTLVRYGR